MAHIGMAPLESPLSWRKASYCHNGECAEVAVEDGEILLRSTRAPAVIVRLTGAEFQAFAKGVAAGEFSDLG